MYRITKRNDVRGTFQSAITIDEAIHLAAKISLTPGCFGEVFVVRDEFNTVRAFAFTGVCRWATKCPACAKWDEPSWCLSCGGLGLVEDMYGCATARKP